MDENRITRRRVIQGAAAVGAGVWVAPAIDSFVSVAAAASGPTTGTIVPFRSCGWTYQLLVGTSPTGGTSTGCAPFGTPVCGACGGNTYYSTVVTDLTTETVAGNGVVISRTITTASGTLSFDVIADDDAAVYVDGTQIASNLGTCGCARDFGTFGSIAVTAGPHTVEIYGYNSCPPPSGPDCAFLDVQITLS